MVNAEIKMKNCDCDSCSLKSICNGIDKVRAEYIESTSTVVKEFNF